MSLLIKARNDDGDYEEMPGDFDEKTLDVTENAEEGSVALSTLTFDDPDLVVHLRGHRILAVHDTEIVSGETALFRGYTADRTYKRGRFPTGRQVEVSVADLNSIFPRRLEMGADCKRPAETDVQRLRWLITTAEAGLINDDMYLSSSSPVNMDKVDYRGKFLEEVLNDCAQASGKNWGMTHNYEDGDGNQIWYGKDELTTYDSGVLITNIESDANGTDVFLMSQDTTLNEDPARVFSGVATAWGDKNALVYRQNADTAHDFARRDTIMNGKLVKTKAKAIARTLRYLNTLDEEEIRIETSILVPRALGNVVRPFHRVQFQSTHLPGTIDTPIYCRVVKRRVTYESPEFWKLGLTLIGGVGAATVSCSTALAGVVVAVAIDKDYVPAGETSITVTPDAGEDSVIIASVLSSNTNVPTDTVMVAVSPSVLVFQDHTAAGAPLGAQIYRVVASASGSYDLDTTFTPGFGASDNSVWCGVAAAIRTSSTSPVQSKGTTSTGVVSVTLDSPPTPGNMLVMSAAVRASFDPITNTIETNPTTGWTLLGYAYAYSPHEGGGPRSALYARCVQSGDGSTYGAGVGGGGNYSVVAVSEWEIT